MSLTLPTDPHERELALRQMVADGTCEYAWSTITSEYNGKTAEFSVFSDALKIEGVRINVSAESAQVIADTLGCMMLTPKLADLMWLQRNVTLPPLPRGNTNGMSSTQAMIDHSAKIDAHLAAMADTSGLIFTTGKHWVIDNAIDGQFIRGFPMAMNYGWHFEGLFDGNAFEATASLIKDPAGHLVRLIQGRGTRHDFNHTDYSQILMLVSKTCSVDGVEMDLAALLSDPDLAPLASHQGVLKVLRQPGVPLAA